MGVETMLLLALGGLLLVLLSAKVLSSSIGPALKAAVNALLGLGSLLALNATAAFTGLSLGVNLFNALGVGVLGVPGLALLLLVQWLFT